MARILTITNWYPPHNRGGYEVSCADVMKRMVARGHLVEVLCSDERLPGVSDEVGPVPVRRQLRMYWKAEAPWTPGLQEQLRIERTNQAALEDAIEDLEPDVVSVWHLAAISLNLMSTVARKHLPIVYAICDAWPTYTLLMDPWSKRFNLGPPRRVAGKLTEAVIGIPAVLPDLGAIGRACFVSEFTRNDVQQNSRWSFNGSEIIPSGIDRSELRGADVLAERPWQWKIAYLGRFDARKGTDTLIRALALLPRESSLVMYGRGGEGERRRLDQLAADLGLQERVTFGTLDRSELAAAYRSVDCVVFPSEWAEPFGLVPLEAMECGTPVVATGVGGSADFLQDAVNCLLFHPGDPDDLAQAVRRLATDPELRGRIRGAGRETARSYDVEHMADAYEQAFLTASNRQSQ